MLVWLRIGHNDVGNQGAKAVADALQVVLTERHHLLLCAVKPKHDRPGDGGVWFGCWWYTRDCSLSGGILLKKSTLKVSLQCHPAMRSLNIHTNSIGDEGAEAICRAALTCPAMKYLDLWMCQISTIPLSFQLAPHSIEVVLAGNPLRSPPAAVAEQGHEAVSAYWSDLRAEHVPLDRVRLMLVGHGGVGKTTLAQALSLKPEQLPGFQKSLKGIVSMSLCCSDCMCL